MNTESHTVVVATVTLNPAIDRTIAIPNFAAGAVNRVVSERDSAGGKGVNVASVLADCGLRAGVTGFLGRENAASFEALFAQKKIVDRFVRIAGRTRLGIKIIDPVLKLTTDINFPGLAPGAEDVAALRERLCMLKSAWWVVAGSVPVGLDPAICREIVAALKERGARVVVDASGSALRQAIEAGPRIIKPNLEEFRELVGKPLADTGSVIGAARELLGKGQKGIELVAVSMGREGACFVTATEAVIAHSPDVEVGSTVGAGDAMVAGIVAAQIRGLALEECARLASAFSLRALTQASLAEAMSQVAVERSVLDRGPH